MRAAAFVQHSSCTGLRPSALAFGCLPDATSLSTVPKFRQGCCRGPRGAGGHPRGGLVRQQQQLHQPHRQPDRGASQAILNPDEPLLTGNASPPERRPPPAFAALGAVSCGGVTPHAGATVPACAAARCSFSALKAAAACSIWSLETVSCCASVLAAAKSSRVCGARRTPTSGSWRRGRWWPRCGSPTARRRSLPNSAPAIHTGVHKGQKFKVKGQMLTEANVRDVHRAPQKLTG